MKKVTIEEADDMVRMLIDEMMSALSSVDVDLVHHYMRLSRAWDDVRETLLAGQIVSERPTTANPVLLSGTGLMWDSLQPPQI